MPNFNLPKTPRSRKARTSLGASTTKPPTYLAEIGELANTLRKYGIEEFRQGDLHIKLAHVAQPLSVPDEQPHAVQGPPPSTSVELSHEDLLFWSTDPLEEKAPQ